MRVWLVLVIVMLMVLPSVNSYIEGSHRNYDWEADNEGGLKYDPSRGDPDDTDTEGAYPRDPPWFYESCYACHEKGIWGGAARKCESCHFPPLRVDDVNGPFKHYEAWNKTSKIFEYNLNLDYAEETEAVSVPMVYQHYYGASINVPNQRIPWEWSGDIYNGWIQVPLSSCFGYNNRTGEGTCHGVSEIYSEFMESNYFSFREGTSFSQSDPYTLQSWSSGPKDSMPDTSDCLFCHSQRKTLIQLAWGSPSQVVMTSGTLEKETCWGCHVTGGGAPSNFHAETMLSGDGTSPHVVESIIPAGGGGGGGGGGDEVDLAEALFSEGISPLTSDDFKLVILEKNLDFQTFYESPGVEVQHTGGQKGSMAYKPIVAPLILTGLYPVLQDTSLRSTIMSTTKEIEGDPYNISTEHVLKQFAYASSLVIARGDLGADSMAAIAYAKAEKMPILLTKPDELPQVTVDAVRKLRPNNIIIAGGPVAVSEEVEAELKKSATVERSYGETRVETAVALAEKITDPSVVVVTDFSYLSTDAAIMSYLFDAPLLYTNTTHVQPVLEEYLEKHKTTSEGKVLRVVTVGVGEQAATRIAEIVGTG